MSRRTNQATGVSLFPFLDVLMCTMGALILMLVIITGQTQPQPIFEDYIAREEALKAVVDPAELAALSTRRAALAQQLDLARSRRDEIAQALAALSARAQSTERELDDVTKKASGLESSVVHADQETLALQQELAAAEDEVRKAMAAFESAQRGTGHEQPTYAIVPYEGPNGTDRRPLYIECRADGIILQPEGVELVESDFEGPLGPGSPMVAGLRAIRDRLVRNRRTEAGEPGEPYPLLLVRPDGIGAYYAAREALGTWRGEFGYELIDEDWDLKYPPADPELADAAAKAIADARTNQRRWIVAAPRSYGAGPRPVYRASPSGGGLIRDDTPYDPAEQQRAYARRRNTGRNGWGGDSGTPGSGSGNSLRGGATPDGTGSGGGDGTLGGDRLAGTGGAPGELGGDGTGGSGFGSDAGSRGHPGGPAASALGGGPSGNDFELANRGGPGRLESPQGTEAGGVPGGGPSDEAVDGQGKLGDAPAGALADGGVSSGDPNSAGAGGKSSGDRLAWKQMGEGASTEGGTAGPGNRRGTDPSGTSSTATAGVQSSASGNSGGTGSTASAGGGGSEAQPGAGMGSPSLMMEHDDPRNQTATASLAQRRGHDWALPGAAGAAVPISRPLALQCREEVLLLRASAQPAVVAREIPLGERTELAVDELVSAVWQQIDTWGPAGRGMYWRPVLNVYVYPGGEKRAKEISELLANSGLDVQLKPSSQDPRAVAQQPAQGRGGAKATSGRTNRSAVRSSGAAVPRPVN